jgi:transposase-like protein
VDYANGYKNKTVLTRMGEVTFEVPQVRSGGFYPSALDETPYLILDARYERVREAGRVLGVSVALSEAEVHWRAFLDSLIERGLRGVKFIASDDHAGLKAATAPWWGCARSPAFHVVCAGGRKNLGNSDRPIRESPTLEDAFRCHTWPHAVEFPILP